MTPTAQNLLAGWRRFAPLVVIVVAVVAVVNLLSWYTLTVLPSTGDEYSALFQAKVFARLQLTAPRPEPYWFFETHYLASTGDRWYGIYFPYHSALLTLGLWLSSPLLVVSLAAGASVAILHRVVEPIAGRLAALIAALALAVSPSFLFHSASYYNHTSALLFTLAWLRCFERWKATGTHRHAVGAGVFCGLVAFTRPMTGLALVVCWGVWLVLLLRRRSVSLSHAVGAVAGATSVAAVTGLYNLGLNGTITRLACFYDNPRHGEFGFGPSYSLGQALELRAADFVEFGTWATGWDVLAGDLKWSVPPLPFAWVLLLGAAVVTLLHPRARPYAVFGVAFALTIWIAYLPAPVAGGRFGARFYYETLPFWALCVGVTLGRLWEMRHRSARVGVIAVGLLSATSLLVATPRTAQRFRAGNQFRMAPFRAVRDTGLKHAVVFLASVPQFEPSFYARNEPDLSGNLLVRDARCRSWELLDVHPDRVPYRYTFDAKHKRSMLHALPRHPPPECSTPSQASAEP